MRIAQLREGRQVNRKLVTCPARACSSFFLWLHSTCSPASHTSHLYQPLLSSLQIYLRTCSEKSLHHRDDCHPSQLVLLPPKATYFTHPLAVLTPVALVVLGKVAEIVLDKQRTSRWNVRCRKGVTKPILFNAKLRQLDQVMKENMAGL